MALNMSAFTTLLNTPGMSTDSDEYKAMVRKPALSSMSPRTTPAPIRGFQPNITITDELEDTYPMDITDKEALDAKLADLAVSLTDHFGTLASGNNLCTLVGVEQLTVERSGKGFSKVAHIGGEEFVPFEAYAGKRGKIIVRFTPREAAAYETMEMSADEALGKLQGFSTLTNMEGGDYQSHAKRLNRDASTIRERESVKDKFTEYEAIGFGTF